MTDRAAAAYEAWKRADGEARMAEHKLSEAWDRFVSRTGETPPSELIHDVASLRAAANIKLTAALRAIDEAKDR